MRSFIAERHSRKTLVIFGYAKRYSIAKPGIAVGIKSDIGTALLKRGHGSLEVTGTALG
jgi:hypothetical protein